MSEPQPDKKEYKKKQPQLLMTFGEALGRFAKVNVKDIPETTDEYLEDEKPAPFLKWVGGKRSLIDDLIKRMPDEFNDYWEPFVGGGALYFKLCHLRKLGKAHISDVNIDLIFSYKAVQKDTDKLIEFLKVHAKNHNEEYYYKIRAQHDLKNAIEIAARMIYLNKTCFNGLFRVNKKGEFNVPVGRYTNPAILNEDNLRACSKALKHATITLRTYADIEPKAGDFVYFDPPYHPTDATSFTQYSKLDFSEKDQKDLADYCLALHKKGVKIMLSNSNTKFIRDLFKNPVFKIEIVNAPRMVNCKPGGRNAVEEVLITNY